MDDCWKSLLPTERGLARTERFGLNRGEHFLILREHCTSLILCSHDLHFLLDECLAFLGLDGRGRLLNFDLNFRR